MSRARAARFAAALVLAASCQRAPLTGPPPARSGSTACTACGMLVTDDRSASALLVEDRGRREYLFFDDAGCMLDHERDTLHAHAVIERYVRDHDTRAWLPADTASFLLADPSLLLTPMGSGIAAFSSPAAAAAARARYSGDVLDFAALVHARRLRTPQPPRPPDPPSDTPAPSTPPAAPG